MTIKRIIIRIWSPTIPSVSWGNRNSVSITNRLWWSWVSRRLTVPKIRLLSIRTCFSTWRDTGRPATTLRPIRTSSGFCAGSAKWNRSTTVSPTCWWRNVCKRCRASTRLSKRFSANWWLSASWTTPTSSTLRITAIISDSLDWSKVNHHLIVAFVNQLSNCRTDISHYEPSFLFSFFWMKILKKRRFFDVWLCVVQVNRFHSSRTFECRFWCAGLALAAVGSFRVWLATWIWRRRF